MISIIFGSSGQDGYYLNKLLENEGHRVIGVSRSGPGIKVSLTDYAEVSKFIADLKPDFVFHLAAVSATSHNLLFENFQTIVTGSLNILEAVKVYSPETKVFLSGSGLQFYNSGNPINENAALEAGSSYSMARIQSLYAARYYRTFGIKVYFGFFFNHDSPLREEKHVSQMIASAVKRIKNGSREKIGIGNYDVHKEWGFAGDIVRAVWVLVNQDKVFETVIGTGEAYSIRDWLDACFRLIGKNWEDHVHLNAGFVAEYKILVSEPGTLIRLGWKPLVSFNDLANMMVLQ